MLNMREILLSDLFGHFLFHLHLFCNQYSLKDCSNGWCVVIDNNPYNKTQKEGYMSWENLRRQRGIDYHLLVSYFVSYK
jgi:hypothetical protein